MNKRSLLTVWLSGMLLASFFVQVFLKIPACFYCQVIGALTALSLIFHILKKNFFTLITMTCAVLVHLHLIILHAFTQAHWSLQSLCMNHDRIAQSCQLVDIDLNFFGLNWDLSVLTGLLCGLTVAFWIYQSREE